MSATLDRDEYVEQAYFFRVLGERLKENVPLQDLLEHLREEVLATTKLPLALGFLLGELKHRGVLGTAMARIPHYFTAFQTFVVSEAETEGGRFDMRIALDVLREEADYRARGLTPAGIFMFQFETLCRNRLRYDPGLAAIAQDPAFDEDWREWILVVRRQMGIVDLADMIYVRSEYYRQRRRSAEPPEKRLLFGEREGKIAWANRRKDPLFLFAALQRQLGYPVVPRQRRLDPERDLLPLLQRRLERLEFRLKLLEEEQRGGIDITRFYGSGPPHGLDGPAEAELR